MRACVRERERTVGERGGGLRDASAQEQSVCHPGDRCGWGVGGEVRGTAAANTRAVGGIWLTRPMPSSRANPAVPGPQKSRVLQLPTSDPSRLGRAVLPHRSGHPRATLPPADGGPPPPLPLLLCSLRLPYLYIWVGGF